MQTGRWYTMTAWHDAAANTLNIQLDNGTVQSVSYSSGAMDTAQPMSVGAFADGTFLLDGRIDELALYKRVLTDTERTWLYNNGKGRSYADLSAQLHAVTAAVTTYPCPQGEICDYDQAQTGVNNTYGYDANGNQITRVINGVTLTLTYDAEGWMVSVTGQGITASFTYDGDGKRVKSTINSATTYFVGSHYEVSGGVVTKYYYTGSSRVAMKVGSTVYYLLSDHLGSTSLTTDANGDVVSEMRYSAWGGVRYSLGTTPIDYTFTAQYSNMPDFGLMFYNARWYDPAVGRFAQADSIIPGAGQSQAWDRYAYGLNNPSGYRDPDGHRPCGDGEAVDCSGHKQPRAPKPPMPPVIPPSPPGGDPATPWDVGVEWLTGQGPRHHEFREGDPFTELLQDHEYLDEVRLAIILKLLAGDYYPGEMDYYLGGLQGVPKYALDYSTLLTFGQTGNLAVTYLGSYDLNYYVVSADSDDGIAEILIHVANESTLASATHPPVIGYTDFWEETITPLTNNLVPSGPMSTVTQSFWWTEIIYYK